MLPRCLQTGCGSSLNALDWLNNNNPMFSYLSDVLLLGTFIRTPSTGDCGRRPLPPSVASMLAQMLQQRH